MQICGKHLQTFSHRERKKVSHSVAEARIVSFLFLIHGIIIAFILVVQMPDMLNWFGWCTWDAFYTNVTSESLKEGLER